MKNSLLVIMLLAGSTAFAGNGQSKNIECEYNAGEEGMGGVSLKMNVVSSQLQQGSISLDVNSRGDKQQSFNVDLNILGSETNTILTITTEINGIQLSNSGKTSANLSMRGGDFENFTIICSLK